MDNLPRMSKDSYQEFLDSFGIDKEALYSWGISATIFPPVSAAMAAWNDLKERALTNQKVYIRGYGRDSRGTQLYKDLYREILGNSCVEKDPINNAIPHRHIERLTGLKRNADLFNYQVSHIWGHTKNVFMFEAPWNICYTPKIINPFTGHETKGLWPDEFQKLFLQHAYKMYEPLIEDYNRLMLEHQIVEKMEDYLQTVKNTVNEKEFVQFEKDVHSELSLIKL